MKYNQLTESLLNSHYPFIRNKTSRNIMHQEDRSLEMLYRKFNRTLPQLQRSKKEREEKPIIFSFVFSPQSKFIIGWQILNILLIYLYFIQIPIILAFENHQSFEDNQRLFKYLNTPTIIIFICDIVINLNTSFYKDGILKTNPKQIRQNYVTNTFLIDLVSILAILIYEILEFTNQIYNKGLKLYILLFYLRIIKLIKIQRTMNRSFDLNRRTKGFFKLCLLLLKIFLICNAVACSAFYISYNLAKTTIILNKDQTRCTDSCYWVMNVQYADKSLFEYDDAFGIQYVYSLYWASTTMISIGYGDITPKNPTEVSFTVFVQFLSCLLYGYSINEIWSIIQELNSKKNKINFRLNIINTYLRDKRVDPELTSKVNAFLNNYYYSKNLRERQIEAQIISELTPSLRKQIFYQSYSSLFGSRYFQRASTKLIQAACASVKEIGYYEDELVFMDTNKHPCLYYVNKGQLQNFAGKSKTFIKHLYHKDLFGMYEFFTQLYFKSQLKALDYTLLYLISVTDWRNSLKDYEYEFQKYYSTKQQIMLYFNGDELDYKCEFCHSWAHRTQDCLDSQLRDYIIEVYYSSKISDFNERKPYPRRSFKIYTNEKHHKHRSRHNMKQKQRFRSEIHQQTAHRKYSIQQSWKRKSQIDVSQPKDKNPKIFIKNQLTRHQNERNLQRLKKEYNLSQLQDRSDDQVLTYDAQFQELNIDVVTDFEYYYPKYNIKQQFRGQLTRRRFTKRI